MSYVVLDPDAHERCVVKASLLHKARLRHGTDEDILIINANQTIDRHGTDEDILIINANQTIDGGGSGSGEDNLSSLQTRLGPRANGDGSGGDGGGGGGGVARQQGGVSGARQQPSPSPSPPPSPSPTPWHLSCHDYASADTRASCP